MVHPDDWEILLRTPNAETQWNWLIWLALTGPLMLAATITLFQQRRPRPRRRWVLWTFAGLVAFLTGWGFWRGVETRIIQAACWRDGPDAVSESARQYCRYLPPRND